MNSFELLVVAVAVVYTAIVYLSLQYKTAQEWADELF